jgi:FRG domain
LTPAEYGGGKPNALGIVGRDMPGGFVQYDAPDLPAAVALAADFKAGAQYKYFRGQADSRWPLVSSLARVDEEARKQALTDFTEFWEFARGAPELVPYLQDDDALIATAQHHGLAKTNFIDFSHSPEVAGWFASEGAVPNTHGAIFLVDEEAEKGFALAGGALRFVTPDVPNLWRLQAQEGFFLEAPGAFDHIWPVDRIVFRHGLSASPIPKRHIYPDKKSALELALDQFDLKRRQRRGFEDFLQSVKGSETVFIEITDDQIVSTEDALVAPPAWAAGPNERWADFDVDSTGPTVLLTTLGAGSPMLIDLIDQRRRCADLLTVAGTDEDKLNPMIERLWSGCRPQPYSSAQIARAIVALLRLLGALDRIDLSSRKGLAAAANALHGPSVEIEMSTAGENAARAFVSIDRLRATLKDEVRAQLDAAGTKTGDAWLTVILQGDWKRPGRNFDGARLVDLFVDQIIPWQIATRRDTVAFSAFLVRTLGRP